LFVAHLLIPIYRPAFELFPAGDMNHGRGCTGTMPMFFTGSDADYVTWPNYIDWAAEVNLQEV
jgi:hypothetical protein